MTAFAATVPDAWAIDNDEDQPVRAARTDSVIAQNRAATPVSLSNQREAKRLSIGELNAMDMGSIRERFDKTRVDDRGPLTRFLDVIDLPRNALFNIVAPSIGKRQREAGERGTFGMGTVRTSDILKELGVENSIVRGVAGFVGDVVFDPLTYLGPPGWGAKAVSAGGKGITYTRAFRQAADEAIRAAKAGAEAADPAIRRYLRASGITGSTAGREAEVSARLFGGKPTRSNKIVSAVFQEPIETGKASSLADDILAIGGPDTPVEQVERLAAAKHLYQQYGRQSAPGLRIGMQSGRLTVQLSKSGQQGVRAETGILHFPFTDIGVYVPAFTPGAKQAETVANIAGAGAQFRGTYQSAAASAINQYAQQIDELANEVRDSTDTINILHNARARLSDDAIEAATDQSIIAPTGPEAPRGTDDAIPTLVDDDTDITTGTPFSALAGVGESLDETIGAELAANQARIRAAREQLAAALTEIQTVKADPATRIDELLYINQHVLPAANNSLKMMVAELETQDQLLKFQRMRGGEMAENLSDNVAARYSGMKGAHEQAETARRESSPFVERPADALRQDLNLTKGERRVKGGLEEFEVDPASRLGNPTARSARETDPELWSDSAREYAYSGPDPAQARISRANQDRAYILRDAHVLRERNKWRGPIEWVNPAMLQPGDTFQIGSSTATVLRVDDGIMTLTVLDPPATFVDGVVTVPKTKYYQVPENEPLPSTAGTLSRAGEAITPYTRAELDPDGSVLAELTREERARYRERLNTEADRIIFDTPDDVLQSRGDLSDVLHEEIKAKALYSQAIKGSIESAMNSNDRQLRDVAAFTMGLDPDTIGWSPFMPIAAAAHGLGNDRGLALATAHATQDIAGWLRRTFGNKSGEISNIARAINRSQSPQSSEVYNRIITELTRDVNGVMDRLSIPQRVGRSVRQVLGAMIDGAYEQLPPAGDLFYSILDDAIASGAFSKSAYPQLWNELLPLVEKWKPTLDRIKTVDQQAGMLAGGLDNYGLGRRLTGEASQRIRNQLESFSAQDRTPSAAATGALES